MHHVAIMAIFGDTPNEKITFKIIKGAGTADDPVKEGQAEEIHLFVPNGTTGLVDTDYDGRLDTWSPVVLHVKDTPTVIREVSTGEVKGDKVQVVYTLTGQRVHMDAVARGTKVLVNGKERCYKLFLHFFRQRQNQPRLAARSKRCMSAGIIAMAKANWVSSKRAVCFMLISFSRMTE